MVVHFHPVPDDSFGHIFRFPALLVNLLCDGQLDANGGPWVHGLGEPALVDAVIEQHRPFFGLNKQPCSFAEDVVAVGNPPFEHGAFQACPIHMGVEVVSRHIGEIRDVSLRDRVPSCGDGVAHVQLFKVFAEHVGLAFRPLAAGLVLLGDGTERGGMPLDGRSLHVVLDAAKAAHFFAAACTTWPTVNQQRHGGSMACALSGAFAVQHQDASVHGSGLTNKGRGCISVEGGDAAAKGAFAFGGQRHGLFNVPVGHQRAHGAKRFHVVHGCAVVRIVLAHQHGREEGPSFGVGAKRLGRLVLSKNPLRLLFNPRDLI